MTKIQIKIPFKTPSTNSLYFTNRYTGMRTKSSEARELAKVIEELVLDTEYIPYSISQQQKLKVRIDVHENWYTLTGTIRKKDVANREKFLVDSVFKALEIDDSRIFTITLNKIQIKKDKKEYSIITIETI